MWPPTKQGLLTNNNYLERADIFELIKAFSTGRFAKICSYRVSSNIELRTFDPTHELRWSGRSANGPVRVINPAVKHRNIVLINNLKGKTCAFQSLLMVKFDFEL